jgi:hypothetical protein
LILNEFCGNTKYNRKYAIRLLHGPPPKKAARRLERLGRGETAAQQALDAVASTLPFALPGVDSDNDSEFINGHLKSWGDEKKIQMTRGRPYKKDDNAHIEQKNWTHVRKLLGWERYDTSNAVTALNDLYRQELLLWMNLYLPAVKLRKKVRVGSKLRRVYDAARTPFERVQASPQAHASRVAELQNVLLTLNPFQLAQRIDRGDGWPGFLAGANAAQAPMDFDRVSFPPTAAMTTNCCPLI